MSRQPELSVSFQSYASDFQPHIDVISSRQARSLAICEEGAQIPGAYCGQGNARKKFRLFYAVKRSGLCACLILAVPLAGIGVTALKQYRAIKALSGNVM
jgi:hypothetical protein